MFKDALVLLADELVGADVKDRWEGHGDWQRPDHAHHRHAGPEGHSLGVEAVVGDSHVACNANAEQHEGSMEAKKDGHEGHHLAAEHAVSPGRAVLDGHQDKGKADRRADGVGEAEVQKKVVGCLV